MCTSSFTCIFVYTCTRTCARVHAQPYVNITAGMSTVQRKQGLCSAENVDDIKMARKSRIWVLCGRNWRSWLILKNRFLDHVYLGSTQRECKSNENIIVEHKNMFESLLSVGTTEKLLGWEETLRKNCRVVTRYGRTCEKCVERYCEPANKKTEQLYNVSTLLFGRP